MNKRSSLSPPSPPSSEPDDTPGSGSGSGSGSRPTNFHLDLTSVNVNSEEFLDENVDLVEPLVPFLISPRPNGPTKSSTIKVKRNPLTKLESSLSIPFTNYYIKNLSEYCDTSGDENIRPTSTPKKISKAERVRNFYIHFIRIKAFFTQLTFFVYPITFSIGFLVSIRLVPWIPSYYLPYLLYIIPMCLLLIYFAGVLVSAPYRKYPFASFLGETILSFFTLIGYLCMLSLILIVSQTFLSYLWNSIQYRNVDIVYSLVVSPFLMILLFRNSPKYYLGIAFRCLYGYVPFLPLYFVVIPIRAVLDFKNHSWGTRGNHNTHKTKAEGFTSYSSNPATQMVLNSIALSLIFFFVDFYVSQSDQYFLILLILMGVGHSWNLLGTIFAYIKNPFQSRKWHRNVIFSRYPDYQPHRPLPDHISFTPVLMVPDVPLEILTSRPIKLPIKTEDGIAHFQYNRNLVTSSGLRFFGSNRHLTYSAMIPTYNEPPEALLRTIDSFINSEYQDLPAYNMVGGLQSQKEPYRGAHLTIVFDGIPNVKMLNTILDYFHSRIDSESDTKLRRPMKPFFSPISRSKFMTINEAIPLKYPAHGIFQFECKQKNKHYFNDDPPSLLYGFLVKNPTQKPLFITLLVKQKNQRKRHSQLLWWQYLNALNSRIMIPKFLLFVDSDVRFYSDAIYLLISSFRNLTCGAACGDVRVDIQNIFNPLEHAQTFEYQISHRVDKFNENAFASVECLPGAFCAVRTQAFREVLKKPLAGISYDTAVHQLDYLGANCVEIGEDRFLTTLLIQAGYLTNWIGTSVCYTLVPTTIHGFMAQRRRWVNSTIANLHLLSKRTPQRIDPSTYEQSYNLLSRDIISVQTNQDGQSIGIEVEGDDVFTDETDVEAPPIDDLELKPLTQSPYFNTSPRETETETENVPADDNDNDPVS